VALHVFNRKEDHMAVRVGVVGFGKMGAWHAQHVREQPGYTLQSIFDLVPARREAARQNFPCAVYDSLSAFLQDPKLDLAVIATPSSDHVKPTLAALQAGKHCLVEKPICTNTRDAARMFAAAKRARRSLVAFQNRRWDDYFLTTHKVVESGRLGTIFDIRFVGWNYSRLMQTYGVKEFRPQWRSEARYGGGVLFDFGAHYLDQLLLLCPQPIADVYGDLRARRWTRDADDQFFAVVRFRGGAVAHIECSHNAMVPFRANWTINGSDGAYQFADGKGTIYWRTAAGKERAKTVPAVPTAWPVFYRKLRAHLTRGDAPPVLPQQSLRLMKLIDAVRQSARSGRVVRFKE
jgi:scyllo-inositol 2-dehydrogenase (NADP+)